ncbi:hypothetical protein BD560DRAFT_385726 [Blakeslea trispora]|nr:hypothetical protein BD560DRAFT_385726 [Blakeslea trispora]
MGKPTKPRVKGNMKPASSSRAAELGGAGHALSFDHLGGFAQFVGGTSTIGSTALPSRPSTPSEVPATDNLDPELVVILKKISKRDAVTKLKALEELDSYLKQNRQTVSRILQNWVIMYSKLVLEVDRRVRLVANQVHALITADAKKKLAPFLKELIGPWLLAMYDQSKDVAKVAQLSFKAVFAQEKRLGAISFCQKELLDYVTDILLFKTADTLSDARYVTKEDMLAKYARVVSSCFQVLCFLIMDLPVEERMKYDLEYNVLMDDSTMWKKFLSHESSLIRKALYMFIKTLLLHWEDKVESRLELICPYFYPCVFTEKDPVTHSDMWDALLLMTKKQPRSWLIIGKKKPALPKLYNFLRSGLNGSPSIAYPSALALLANLPQEFKDTPNFYNDVFDNFWKGLSSDYIDKSNSHIFLNAYAECIVYFAITLSKQEDPEAKKTASHLIQQTFWSLFEVYFLNSRDKAVNEKIELNSYAFLAKHLVVLSTVDCTKDYLTAFWSNLDQVLVQTVVDCDSIVTRAPLDMDIFCQKTSKFLAAIQHETASQNDLDKLASIETSTVNLAKRLLVSSVESSLVHKDKSFGLLVLANQLLSSFSGQTMVHHDSTLLSATRQLLRLFEDAPDASIGPLASYYVTFIHELNDKPESQVLWKAWMEQLFSMLTTPGLELRSANTLVLALERLYNDKIQLDEGYQSSALDSAIKLCTFSKLSQVAIVIPRSVLQNFISSALVYHFSCPILSSDVVTEIYKQFAVNLEKMNTLHYTENTASTASESSVQIMKTALSTLAILQSVFKNHNDLQDIPNHIQLVGQLFDAIFITRKTMLEDEELVKAEEDEQLTQTMAEHALSSWHLVSTRLPKDVMTTLLEQAKSSITDVRYSTSPTDAVLRVETLSSTTGMPKDQVFFTLIGTKEEWDKLTKSLLEQVTTSNLVLGIVNPFASADPKPLIDDEGELIPVVYDIYGLSSLGRLLSFVSEYLTANPLQNNFESQNDWLMLELMKATVACQQGLVVPGLCRLYDTRATEGIQAFVDMSYGILEHWISVMLPLVQLTPSEWNSQLLQTIQKGNSTGSDRLVVFVSTLMLSTDALSAHLLQHVFQRLLLLLNLQSNDLEKWLILLKAETKELELLSKVAVLNAIKSSLDGTEAYNRYQSDLASKLSGVTQWEQLDYDPEVGDIKQKTNYSLLVLLNTSSLKHNAIHIPRQRIMYLIQGIRPLLTQDDDGISNDQQKYRVRAQYAKLLKYLAESIQDVVSGSHWDFFLTSCIRWIGYADTTQPEELLVVHHALGLLQTLHYLADDNNEELQDLLKENRRILASSLVQLMVKEQEYLEQQKKAHAVNSKARLAYQTLLSELLENIPEKTLIDNDCFSHLNALIQTQNDVLQKRAYSLLRKYVAHHVQDLSVKLEFTETSEEETKTEIEETILSVILSPPDLSSWQLDGLEESATHETLGYLLTWMLMFDHFTNITFKLKQEYTAQLKEKEAVSCLMTALCRILSIGQQQSKKPFDLTPWSITEYIVDGFDTAYETSFLILASHLYYRALTHIPSLVRLWWIDCKNRQVTIAVENYTEKYFSQQLINNEIELVNRPDIKSQLEDNEDNNFTVKTSKGANEVTATYRVDEQNMQIAIKLPSNFPLRQIDVEGVQKVGVNDKQWRGWMFAVSAVIGSQVSLEDIKEVFERERKGYLCLLIRMAM